MRMRMRQLVSETGIPRSTIQHYVREGLLPKPIKLAHNSAVYGEAHIRRLDAIGRAKRLLGDRPPLAQIKRIVELIEQGVTPEVAVALQRAVWSTVSDLDPGEADVSLTVKQLASEVGVDPARIRALVDAGLLVPAPGPESPRFDFLDLRLARMVLEVTGAKGVDLGLAARVSSLLREVSAIEMEIRNRIVAGRPPQEAAAASAELQTLGPVWHAYLAFRFRQWDIAQEGLGPIEATP